MDNENRETRDLSNSVKAIMETQLTELEVIVYLMVEGGYTDYKVADLPLGISRSTARRINESAKAKIKRQADGGMFQTELQS